MATKFLPHKAIGFSQDDVPLKVELSGRQGSLSSIRIRFLSKRYSADIGLRGREHEAYALRA